MSFKNRLSKIKNKLNFPVKYFGIYCERFSLVLFIFAPIILHFSYETYINTTHIIVFQVFLLLFFILRKKKSLKIRLSNRSYVLFILYLLIAIFSIFISKFPVQSLTRLVLAYFLIFSVLIFLDNVNDIYASLGDIFKTMISLSLISSLYLVIIYQFGNLVFDGTNTQFDYLEVFDKIIYQLRIGRRPASFYSNPNTFGMIALLGISATLAIFHIRKISLKRVLLFIPLVSIQLYALILSGSRSSLLGVTIIITSYLFIRLLVHKNYFLLVISLISINSLVYLILPKIRQGFGERFVIWSHAINLMNKSYLLGVGFGVSNESVMYQFNNLSTHNSYIKIFTETGIVGLLSILLIVLNSLYLLLKQFYLIDMKDERKWVNLCLVSLILGFSIQQFFETNLFVYNFFMAYWILIISIPFFLQRNEDT